MNRCAACVGGHAGRIVGQVIMVIVEGLVSMVWIYCTSYGQSM